MGSNVDQWTQQLFCALGRLTGTPIDMGQSAAHGAHHPPVLDEQDVMKKECLDLLFMVPGPGSRPAQPEALSDDVVTAATGYGAEATDHCRALALYARAPPQTAAEAAEAAQRSSAALLKALSKLRRVEDILRGCSEFWAGLDRTAQTLSRMREHTQALVGFASRSAALKERFDQRFSEYRDLWARLERLCEQYVADAQTGQQRVQQFLRQVEDAADVFDTAGLLALDLGDSTRSAI